MTVVSKNRIEVEKNPMKIKSHTKWRRYRGRDGKVTERGTTSPPSLYFNPVIRENVRLRGWARRRYYR